MKEIKTTTTYTEERIKKFLNIHYFDKIKVVRIILNILIVVVIINFFKDYKRTITDIITFVFALLGLLEINTSFLPKFNYYKLKRKKDNIINAKITYIFKKNNFKLTTDKDEYIDYNTLKKVIETNTDYYLYINNSRSLIVGKEDLSKEEISSLTERLKKEVSTYTKKNV